MQGYAVAGTADMSPMGCCSIAIRMFGQQLCGIRMLGHCSLLLHLQAYQRAQEQCRGPCGHDQPASTAALEGKGYHALVVEMGAVALVWWYLRPMCD
jgi:hypothetical protein